MFILERYGVALYVIGHVVDLVTCVLENVQRHFLLEEIHTFQWDIYEPVQYGDQAMVKGGVSGFCISCTAIKRLSGMEDFNINNIYYNSAFTKRNIL